MESFSEAAYYASGCRSAADFLSSPLCQAVQNAYLGDNLSWNSHPPQGELKTLHFSPKNLRAREEAKAGGGLARFLHALPTSIPTCSWLGIFGVELASLDELTALCHGIASPLCTLHSLECKEGLSIVYHTVTDTSNVTKRLIGDALLKNTSLRQLIISSDLFPEDHWVSVLSRSDCSIKDLHVSLVSDDTLDHMLGIFTGLAHNTIFLTTLSITGPYNPLCDINPHSFTRPMILDSERQLGITLLTNTSLTSLHISNLSMPNGAFLMLFASLSKNPNLTDFSLCGYPYLPGEVVRMLFTSLEENPHLTSLSVAYSIGEDWPSASSVLDSLRINGMLTQLEFDETPFEEELSAEEEIGGVTLDAILNQLEMNGKNAEQLKALKSLTLE